MLCEFKWKNLFIARPKERKGPNKARGWQCITCIISIIWLGLSFQESSFAKLIKYKSQTVQNDVSYLVCTNTGVAMYVFLMFKKLIFLKPKTRALLLRSHQGWVWDTMLQQVNLHDSWNAFIEKRLTNKYENLDKQSFGTYLKDFHI